MIIKYKVNQYVEFKTLFRGDFFICNGVLYLKVENSDKKYNAFNCENHILSDVDAAAKVRPINIELQEV